MVFGLVLLVSDPDFGTDISANGNMKGLNSRPSSPVGRSIEKNPVSPRRFCILGSFWKEQHNSSFMAGSCRPGQLLGMCFCLFSPCSSAAGVKPLPGSFTFRKDQLLQFHGRSTVFPQLPVDQIELAKSCRSSLTMQTATKISLEPRCQCYRCRALEKAWRGAADEF